MEMSTLYLEGELEWKLKTISLRQDLINGSKT